MDNMTDTHTNEPARLISPLGEMYTANPDTVKQDMTVDTTKLLRELPSPPTTYNHTAPDRTLTATFARVANVIPSITLMCIMSCVFVVIGTPTLRNVSSVAHNECSVSRIGGVLTADGEVHRPTVTPTMDCIVSEAIVYMTAHLIADMRIGADTLITLYVTSVPILCDLACRYSLFMWPIGLAWFWKYWEYGAGRYIRCEPVDWRYMLVQWVVASVLYSVQGAVAIGAALLHVHFLWCVSELVRFAIIWARRGTVRWVGIGALCALAIWSGKEEAVTWMFHIAMGSLQVWLLKCAVCGREVGVAKRFAWWYMAVFSLICYMPMNLEDMRGTYWTLQTNMDNN